MSSITRETKLTIIYILVAFTFSVLMRMIWVYQFENVEAFKHAGELMINTNDGYFWAEGARDILSGVSQINNSSPVTTAPSKLTAFIASILPFSFETIILYLPVYLSSLIVIPIILIAKDLKNLEMGFIAALLSSIAWSYYNRTMVGYYDTDMLNIVIPMFLLWSIIWAIDTKKDIFLLITALDILLYRWWYPQSYALEFSFFGLILLYTLVFDRKNMYNYKLLAIMMLAMLNINEMYRIPLVLGAFIIFQQEQFQKYIYYILGISLILFFTTGAFDPIWAKLKVFVFKDVLLVGEEGLKLHFYSVAQTIREAGQIPFETFANRISGHVVTFTLSLIGYVYLVYRHKIMIFALPLVGLGFLASVGGLRFTVYAVPILAFGIAFLITELSSKIPNKNLKYLSMVVFTLAILYPNYKHIEGYRVPTVFNSNEVAILDTLKVKADREDYAIAWWDYGYPIRYYGDVKTLTDGGKHEGNVNFPVSFTLTSSQIESAKMARLDVEYTEGNRYTISEKNTQLNDTNKIKYGSNIEKMTKDYGFQDTNDFLLSLQTDIKLPSKTRDVYFYLPYKMLNIYPTINIFSNLNLMDGKQGKQPFFYQTSNFKDEKNKINLGRNIFINRLNNTLELAGQKVPIKRFAVTSYDQKGKLLTNIKNISSNGKVNIIYMSNYKKFLVLDDKVYNSLFIQLMVLEQYDKNLFEKVSANPHAKLYKLKI